MNKPFKTLDEQIALLRSRGLTIENESLAQRILHRNSYYDIVNGYKNYFLDNTTQEEKFITGATLQNLYDLYLFDTNLRDITLSTIQNIEHTLRSIVAYRIAEAYGSDERDYLIRSNYNLGKPYSKGYELDKLFKKFDRIIQDDIHPFKHYREVHGNCPPWILLKGTSFGNLITFIKLQKNEIKDKIISDFFSRNVSEITPEIKAFFMSSLWLLLAFRNRAAHGNRIYNFKPSKETLQVPYCRTIHLQFYITKRMYHKGIGVNDWNAIIVFLSYINDSIGDEFLSKLVSCFTNYLGTDNLSEEVVKEGMRLSSTIIRLEK